MLLAATALENDFIKVHEIEEPEVDVAIHNSQSSAPALLEPFEIVSAPIIMHFV